jgi:hypothetical protein
MVAHLTVPQVGPTGHLTTGDGHPWVVDRARWHAPPSGASVAQGVQEGVFKYARM